MQHFIEFFLFLFWFVCFLFLGRNVNVLVLLILSELMWCVLYVLTILFGLVGDNISLLAISFFILTFAAIEFVLGLFLILLFKNLNSESLNFSINSKNTQKDNLFNLKKIYFNFIKF